MPRGNTGEDFRTIAVGARDESRPGQEASKPPPHLGRACYPLKVTKNPIICYIF